MPELPEVETVCQGLRPWLEGRRLHAVHVHHPRLRVPIPRNLTDLAGYTVHTMARRGKTMLWHMRGADGRGQAGAAPVVMVHLGMSGHFEVNPREIPRHGHVEWITEQGDRCVYVDPRRFGAITLAPTLTDCEDALAGLGPEPFAPEWMAVQLQTSVASRRAPIKALLMDQAVVAGIGNIYASEALFHARINPLRPGNSLTLAECRRLQAAVRQVLTEAIAAGGSSLRDHHHPNGTLGCFQHRFQVYDRQGARCTSCHSDWIVQHRLAGRSTFWCPTCQPA